MYPYTNPNILIQGINFLKSIKWGTILEGTSKTLGVINQAIPVVYQAKPLLANVKTIFKIANEINTDPKEEVQKKKTNNSPIFYI